MTQLSALNGKHIILGITGSIAAYKAAPLARLLIKGGAEVQIVMTPAACEFITPLTLSTLTSRPVITEFFSRRDGSWNSHVDLGLWADVMLIAPATAATLGKMVSGVADNMLITTYLSAKAPVFIAPAMDLDMYQHPSTESNIKTLKSWGCHIIEAADGFLASHLTGKGRMQEPEAIVAELENFFDLSRPKPLKGRRILITAGPTYERIDPVRFIGNYSSGRMGIALAKELLLRGAEVDLILGPCTLDIPKGIRVKRVESALEMLHEAEEVFPLADAAIFSAAVADYRPANESQEKIKRERTGDTSLQLTRNPDIAATLGAAKQEHQRLIGFALETDQGREEAIRKLHTKNLDAIVLNSLRDLGAGFGTDTNKVCIINPSDEAKAYELKSKAMVAADIADYLTNLLPIRI